MLQCEMPKRAFAAHPGGPALAAAPSSVKTGEDVS